MNLAIPGSQVLDKPKPVAPIPKGIKYFHNLDALRFIAFLGVFLCHCIAVPGIIPQKRLIGEALQNFCFNGARGVEMFFVISGFIITYLLVSEKMQTGGISLKNFYIRRTLRIWPLFYLIIFYVFIVKPFLAHSFGIHWQFSFSDDYLANKPNPWLWLCFLGNFDIVFHGAPPQSELHLLWSLCVEEQFYLFWPIILKFIKIKQIPYALLCGVAISTACRILFLVRWGGMESNFDTLILLDFFAIGGLLAYMINMKETETRHLVNTRVSWKLEWLFLGMVLFMIAFDTYANKGLFETSFKYPFYAIVFSMLILSFEFKSNSIKRLKSNEILSFLGKRSYGLYMFHMVVWTILYSLLKNSYNLWVVALLTLAGTIILSSISYKFFEAPFLKLAKRFRRV